MKKSMSKAAQSSKKTPKSGAKKTAVQSKHSRARTGGLGRGIDALLGDQSSAEAVKAPVRPALTGIVRPAVPAQIPADSPANCVLTVPVTEIDRSPWQPRQSFDEAALKELSDSIRVNGIIQPLVCRRLPTGRFELIGGERRLRAAMTAELKHVPVILVDAEDRRAAELAIIENIQRADLNAIEEAEGYRTLAEHFHLTQSEVAERVGKPRPSVANAMRLLDLPDETKAMVADGRLAPGHAKVLLGLQVTEDRIRLGRRAVAESMTVRALERAVQMINNPPPVRRLPQADLPETYLRDLTDKLHAFFGTAVRLSPSKTMADGHHAKGTLEVDFFNNEDLDRILTMLGIRVD